ncbi:MAG: ATP-binding protein [Bacteroidota bacterium]
MMEEQTNILIVEDEELVLQSLYNIISRRYSGVYVAKNAQKALEIFEKEEIDVVLADIHLPGMDGISMLKKMKSHNKNIHRIIMSAHTESEYFLHAIDLGIDAYIIKPFLKEQVLEAIEKASKFILAEKTREFHKKKLDVSIKKLRQLNKNKDKFFTVIGHDIKTPISTIASYSDYLLENIEDASKEETIEMLGIIKKSSLQALDLLKELLEWAKVQSGSFNYKPEIINLCDTIAQEVEFASLQCKTKNITVDYHPKTDNYVYADKNMSSTIIRNLLSNAIKFTEQNGKITLKSEKIINKKKFIKISVSDNGIGIPKKIIPHLFSMNNFLSSEGTFGETGSGMGLLLCKEFVDIHGGSIQVESEEGKGSTFSFSLPMEKP